MLKRIIYSLAKFYSSLLIAGFFYLLVD